MNKYLLRRYDTYKGTYTYQRFTITNNVGKIGEICFTSANAITDFALNNAQHFVDRMIKSNR